MSSKIIKVNHIPILLEKSSRAKHINISLRPFKGVRVAVPRRVSFKNAEKVAESKIKWIEKHLDRIEHKERTYEALIKNSKKIDRKEASKILTQRLNELALKYVFTFNKVFIKNQRTRWGSCSEKNNINLNYHLARLPGELIDYTILHELVHTRIKNHSKKFWNELERFVKDAKQVDKKLNQYEILLA